jgi:PilZ domain
VRTEHASLHDVKQRSKRTKLVVPVSLRIAGSEASHLAHTLDVSNHGVKLRGCRGEMKVGDKIEIRYRQKRAQFRVAWITIPRGSSEKQIGAECLELRTRKVGLGCAVSRAGGSVGAKGMTVISPNAQSRVTASGRCQSDREHIYTTDLKHDLRSGPANHNEQHDTSQ